MPAPYKVITLAQFLTPSEIERARELYAMASEESADRKFRGKVTGLPRERTFHARVLAEIVEPNLGRINKATGQDNDARFVAYALEFCLMQERLNGRKKHNGKKRTSPWRDLKALGESKRKRESSNAK